MVISQDLCFFLPPNTFPWESHNLYDTLWIHFKSKSTHLTFYKESYNISTLMCDMFVFQLMWLYVKMDIFDSTERPT